MRSTGTTPVAPRLPRFFEKALFESRGELFMESAESGLAFKISATLTIWLELEGSFVELFFFRLPIECCTLTIRSPITTNPIRKKLTEIIDFFAKAGKTANLVVLFFIYSHKPV
jgi:hypothetical protein